jgi:hypothetical protein
MFKSFKLFTNLEIPSFATIFFQMFLFTYFLSVCIYYMFRPLWAIMAHYVAYTDSICVLVRYLWPCSCNHCHVCLCVLYLTNLSKLHFMVWSSSVIVVTVLWHGRLTSQCLIHDRSKEGFGMERVGLVLSHCTP